MGRNERRANQVIELKALKRVTRALAPESKVRGISFDRAAEEQRLSFIAARKQALAERRAARENDWTERAGAPAHLIAGHG